jgi:hypothetical protein
MIIVKYPAVAAPTGLGAGRCGGEVCGDLSPFGIVDALVMVDWLCVRRRLAMGRRCLAEGCGRLVRPGKAMCRDHDRTEEARAVAEEVRKMGVAVVRAVGGQGGRGTDVERERAREGFRRGLERGEYRALVDGRVREVFAQAAEDGGLADEVGALRFVLMRLLAEEEDLGKLAMGVSRIATATARVLKTQEGLIGARDTLQEAIDQILEEGGLRPWR